MDTHTLKGPADPHTCVRNDWIQIFPVYSGIYLYTCKECKAPIKVRMLRITRESPHRASVHSMRNMNGTLRWWLRCWWSSHREIFKDPCGGDGGVDGRCGGGGGGSRGGGEDGGGGGGGWCSGGVLLIYFTFQKVYKQLTKTCYFPQIFPCEADLQSPQLILLSDTELYRAAILAAISTAYDNYTR